MNVEMENLRERDRGREDVILIMNAEIVPLEMTIGMIAMRIGTIGMTVMNAVTAITATSVEMDGRREDRAVAEKIAIPFRHQW